MAQTTERRRAPRLFVNIPTLVEKIGHRELHLHPSLAPLYERVHPNGENLGLKFPAAVHDLSANGCFVAGQAMPLLSRVALSFALPGYGQVEALGWVLWRRTGDCDVPVEGAEPPLVLKAGFGVLFEAIPLDARLQIARLVHEHEERSKAPA
ncbi:MAG: PilZ domain-containing protein [Deltaproteobacteria bacterium]|nr:PilZ domain-containing protein [Deltaproteobacteria bacterium]